MAPKGSKSGEIKKRDTLGNTSQQNGKSYRQEILRSVSEKIICRDCAKDAWFESFEADLQKVREELEAVEKAIWKKFSSPKGMTQDKPGPSVQGE